MLPCPIHQAPRDSAPDPYPQPPAKDSRGSLTFHQLVSPASSGVGARSQSRYRRSNSGIRSQIGPGLLRPSRRRVGRIVHRAGGGASAQEKRDQYQAVGDGVGGSSVRD